MLAVIGMYPVCIAAWQAGCAADGALERSPSGDWSKYQNSKCQEWYGTGSENRTGDYWGSDGHDHWVDENYYTAYDSDSNPKKYNDPGKTGYKVVVSNGCPGTYGKYMNMVIGTSAAHMSKVFV